MIQPGESGWPAAKVFENSSIGYTFDDIVLMPGHISFDAMVADLSGRVTKHLPLHLPIIAGAKDSVTEIDMAVSLALIGGLGVIHRNQTIIAQAEMVKRTKRQLNGFILDPISVGPVSIVADVDKIKQQHGFGTVLVTDTGQLGGKLVGVVSSRDIDAVEDRRTLVQDVMTPYEKMTVVKEPITMQGAQERLRKAKVGKIPVVDSDRRVVSLITRADVKKNMQYPRASKDGSGQLLVGAAIAAECEEDWARAVALAEAGADVLFLDVTLGDGDRQISFVKRLKSEWPKVEIAVGPVSSCRMAKRLAEAGADAIRVGSAPQLTHSGEVAAVGRAEATAVYQVARYVRMNYGIPAIAEGGLHNTGQMLKAFALGATAVVLGDMLEGADEAPSATLIKGDGVQKVAHGIEPVLAIHHVRENTITAPNPRNKMGLPSPGRPVSVHAGQGVSTKGSAKNVVQYVERGVKAGLRDMGIKSLTDLHEGLYRGEVRLECRCPFASQHDEARRRAFYEASHAEMLPMLPRVVLAGGGDASLS